MRNSRLATLLFVSFSSVAACVVGDPTLGGPAPGGGSNPGGGSDPSGGSGSDPSGSGSDPSGGSGSITSATAFLAAMDQGDCQEAFKCMSSFVAEGSGDTFAGDFGTSESDCESLFAGDEMRPQVETEITAGKITFDASAASACVAGITYPACATYWTDGATYPTACDTALVGTIADGGACVVDFDCSNIESICNAGTCGPDPDAGSGFAATGERPTRWTRNR